MTESSIRRPSCSASGTLGTISPRLRRRHRRIRIMVWLQKQIQLQPRSRGFHLISREVLAAMPELGEIRAGLLHVFIQHTSASLTINENADSDVRRDLESS